MFKYFFLFSGFLVLLSGCGGGSSSPDAASDVAPQNSANNAPIVTPPPNTSKTFSDLCASPGVLFCDNFEAGIKNDWIPDGGDVQLVNGHAKTDEGSQVVELRTYDTKKTSKLIYTFDNQEKIYVRYDVQYAPDYDNSGGNHGPQLGGSQSPPWGMMGKAGIRPSGSDFFITQHEPININTVGSNGEFGFYAYFVNMIGTPGNTWGNYFKSALTPKPIIELGQWHCVEFGVQLNTANASSTDGKQFFWVDGIQHGNFDGFQWRTDSNLMINTFILDSYNHFNNGPRTISSPNRVRYDNVIVSAQPVGCL